MQDKILIITGDGGECYETLYAIHRLQEAHLKPVIAARTKKRMHLVIHDFEPGWDTYMERPGYELESDITFDQVKVDDYLAVIIIGGRAPEYLRNDPTVIKIVKEFDSKKKWVFAICHGIQIMVAADIVKGRKVTCYEHVRFEVESMGGTFIRESAVRDGHLVSAQTWQDHPAFFREVFKCLAESGAVKPILVKA